MLDVVLWRSRAEAHQAAQSVNSVPDCAAWFRHIAESGGLRHVDVVAGQDRLMSISASFFTDRAAFVGSCTAVRAGSWFQSVVK